MHHSLLVGAGVAVLGAIVGWRFIGTAAAVAGPAVADGDPVSGAAAPADHTAEAVPVA